MGMEEALAVLFKRLEKEEKKPPGPQTRVKLHIRQLLTRQLKNFDNIQCEKRQRGGASKPPWSRATRSHTRAPVSFEDAHRSQTLKLTGGYYGELAD